MVRLADRDDLISQATQRSFQGPPERRLVVDDEDAAAHDATWLSPGIIGYAPGVR
jgi:hypothetical protein